jgi:hypothetical protein
MQFFDSTSSYTTLRFPTGKAMVMEAVVSITDEGNLRIQMPAKAN